MNAAFAAALVAWLVSMPLIAFHFEQVNWWAIPASIILAPIVFIALIGGLFKVVATLWLPSFAGTWASIAAEPMAWMRHVLDWLAQLPGSDWPFPGLPLWGVIAVFVIYALFLLPCPGAEAAHRHADGAVRGRVRDIACAVPIDRACRRRAGRVASDAARRRRGAGGGARDSLRPHGDDRRRIDFAVDPLRKCIGPFLRSRGCTQIDTLLLTHSDYDHIGAAAAMARCTTRARS